MQGAAEKQLRHGRKEQMSGERSSRGCETLQPAVGEEQVDK